MNSDDLLEQVRMRPFAPFRLHMSNGRTHDVRHPEMILVAPGSEIAAVTVPLPNGRTTITIVSLININELEVLTESPAQ